MSNKRFCVEMRPQANKENTVVAGDCRFTVLTDRLIRCEYAKNGVFEDRASQSVFFRDFPKVAYESTCENGLLTVETDALRLTCKTGMPFTADSLQIALKQEPAVWHYGESVENLGGTYKTLDNVNGAIPLEDGVCSRYGYAVMDDSATMLLNEEGWVEVREKDTADLYFFGYGYAYLDAVKDYYRLTGVPPLLPAYALGNWWSRYHAYTQQEYLDLMDRFQREDIPFSVGVVDMDWHITKFPKEHMDKSGGEWSWCSINNGWTGYTWNEEYFPDYKAFLQELHKRNLKTALNLHPHAGVLSYEAQYEAMAKAMGVTPEKGKRIPFDILNPKFMEAYFDILHHPYEKDGVDFWWMDWQQGKSYWWLHEENKDGKMQDEREVLDPLWMLNHLHIADISRNGKRPMFFSRFSGPGSQRYPVGFSGDAVITWESLDFQPYFTATASNVGYAWWSHDIGGHFGGYRDADLALRWVQLGVLSPINRLHSGCDEIIRKEPWTFDADTERIMSKWLRFRHSLFPYLYTMNYRNHHDLEPLVQPMYYQYPKCGEAYNAKNQYFFGSELMVAPITSPVSEVSKMGSVKTFFPAGSWFDFFDGSHYHSDKHRTVQVCRSRESYPVFAKAGAIVPLMQRAHGDNSLKPAQKMEAVIFPGASNVFTLYEDAGDGQEYRTGGCVTTQMRLDWQENKAVFTLDEAQGDKTLLPEVRTWKLCFRGFGKACRIQANTDYEAVYVPETATWEVTVEASVCRQVTVELTGEKLITDNGDRKARCYDILRQSNLDHARLGAMYEIIRKATDWQEAGRDLNHDASSLQEQALLYALTEQLSLHAF